MILDIHNKNDYPVFFLVEFKHQPPFIVQAN